MAEVFRLLHFLVVVSRFIVFGKYGTIEHFLPKLVGDCSSQLNLKLKAGGMLLLPFQCCFPFIITKLTTLVHRGCLISITIFYAFQHFYIKLFWIWISLHSFQGVCLVTAGSTWKSKTSWFQCLHCCRCYFHIFNSTW